MKRLLIIGGGCIILLIAYVYVVPMFTLKPNYVIGFPKEESKGRTNLLLHYGTLNAVKVTEEMKGVSETSRLVFDESPKYVHYESITDEMIDEHFQPIFGSRDDGKRFSKLTDTLIDELEDHGQAATEKGYPAIKIEENNTITMTTMTDEKNIDVAELLSEYGKKGSDFFTLDVQQANEDAFIVSVYFSSSRVEDVYHLFITQDFSTIEVVNGERTAFAEHIATGHLDEFLNLLFKTEVTDQYAIVRGLNAMYDRRNESFIPIDDADVLSEDGKHVYLNGDKDSFKKGKQVIQSTEDYADGNNKNVATFQMNFKQIAKEFGLKGVRGTSRGELIYFNEDYMMYTFSFDAFLFGSAGNVNVIVDLQEDRDNPTFYLFNFRIS